MLTCILILEFIQLSIECSDSYKEDKSHSDTCLHTMTNMGLGPPLKRSRLHGNNYAVEKEESILPQNADCYLQLDAKETTYTYKSVNDVRLNEIHISIPDDEFDEHNEFFTFNIFDKFQILNKSDENLHQEYKGVLDNVKLTKNIAEIKQSSLTNDIGVQLQPLTNNKNFTANISNNGYEYTQASCSIKELYYAKSSAHAISELNCHELETEVELCLTEENDKSVDNTHSNLSNCNYVKGCCFNQNEAIMKFNGSEIDINTCNRMHQRKKGDLFVTSSCADSPPPKYNTFEAVNTFSCLQNTDQPIYNVNAYNKSSNSEYYTQQKTYKELQPLNDSMDKNTQKISDKESNSISNYIKDFCNELESKSSKNTSISSTLAKNEIRDNQNFALNNEISGNIIQEDANISTIQFNQHRKEQIKNTVSVNTVTATFLTSHFSSNTNDRADNNKVGSLIDEISNAKEITQNITDSQDQKSDSIVKGNFLTNEATIKKIYIFSKLCDRFNLTLKKHFSLNMSLHSSYEETILMLDKNGYEYIVELCDFLKNLFISRIYCIYKLVRNCKKILKSSDANKKSIKITLSPANNFSRVINTAVNDTKFLHDSCISESIDVCIDLEEVRLLYIKYIAHACLEYNDRLNLFVLKEKLWGIHAYMAEFYFYIMWKVEKLEDASYIEDKNDFSIILHLKTEIQIMSSIITIYNTVFDSKTDNQDASNELITEIYKFRRFILLYLEQVYPDSLEYSIYFFSLNAKQTSYNNVSLKSKRAQHNGKNCTNIKQKMKRKRKPPEMVIVKINKTLVVEKRNKQNMMFILAFTMTSNELKRLALDTKQKDSTKTFRDLRIQFQNKFNRNTEVQKNLITTVFNIAEFIKNIRNKRKDKVMLIYSNIALKFIIYVDPLQNDEYQLKILTHSNALFYFSEYLRDLMW